MSPLLLVVQNHFEQQRDTGNAINLSLRQTHGLNRIKYHKKKWQRSQQHCLVSAFKALRVLFNLWSWSLQRRGSEHIVTLLPPDPLSNSVKNNMFSCRFPMTLEDSPLRRTGPMHLLSPHTTERHFPALASLSGWDSRPRSLTPNTRLSNASQSLL